MKDKLSPKKKPGRKNRYAGILQPRQVGTGAPEVSVVILYDVENDRIRARVEPLGGVELELPPRRSFREPPTFE